MAGSYTWVYIYLRKSVFVAISTASGCTFAEIDAEVPSEASTVLTALAEAVRAGNGARRRILETYGAPLHAIRPVDAPLIASAVPTIAQRALIGIPGASITKMTGDRPVMSPREESENSLRLRKVRASGPV